MALLGLEKRQLQEDVAASYPCLQGGSYKGSKVGERETMGVRQSEVQKKMYRKMTTVKHWNRLPLELFKTWAAKF